MIFRFGIVSMEEQYRYVRTLPTKIKKAVEEYTGAEFESLNRQLREGGLTSTQRDIVNLLVQAFENVPPISQPITVYRGIKADNPVFSILCVNKS